MTRIEKTLSKAAAFVDALQVVKHVMFAAAVAWLLWNASDREPPFTIESVYPASARAGEMVTITAKVRRDTTRDCSARMSRAIFDAAGTRSDYPSTKFSDAVIDGMERASPGVLRVSLQVPQNASLGSARVVSVLDYRCNRVHALWPIEVTTVMPFEVVP